MGTEDVDQLVRQTDLSGTALIAHVEIATALAKLVRMKSLSPQEAQIAFQNFLQDWPTLIQIQINQPRLNQASTFAWTYGVRGYNAIHLAAAYTWQNLLGETVTFATYDQRLWTTAQTLKIDVFPSTVYSSHVATSP
jgi:predicted nucleic acid-binding protein